MFAPKTAGLLALVGLIGVVVSVVFGRLSATDYLLDASFVCLALAGLVFIVHVIIGLWQESARST